MESDLEGYEYQLTQVELALSADPSNEELQALKTELEEIITLTKEALGVSTTATSSSSSTTKPNTTTTNANTGSSGKDKGKGKEVVESTSSLAVGSELGIKVGEECSAKYKDGKWYPAKLTAITGSSSSPLYTVLFKGYTSPQTLSSSQIRAISSSGSGSNTTTNNAVNYGSDGENGVIVGEGGKKRKMTKEEETRDAEKKKKRKEEWKETQATKTAETLQKKSAWESFGKKAAKKGVKIGGLTGKSIFRTPDNPLGKVGVVGSGQGVTSYEQRGKHKFGGGSGEGGAE